MVQVLTRAELERRRDEVLRGCAAGQTGEELFEAAAERLRRVVPHDGSAWFGLDPATMLATSPAHVDHVDPGQCTSFWPREFLVEDTNLFSRLARQQTPVAALVEATERRPARSARYREFLAPQGYGDELRAVLRTDRTAWGTLSLYRSSDEPPFSCDEVDFVAGLVRPLAEALRARLVVRHPARAGEPTGPGLLMFDRAGTLLSANEAAYGWLEDMGSVPRNSVGLPSPLLVLTVHAVAVADGHERGAPRMRLRGTSGRWLVLHASHLPGARREADMIGVVVEPAASADIAPIIVEGYALTPREQDIISGLARGLSTGELAAELFLSAHTVRDHVKSVLGKVGVSTRGELVAKLFADHYASSLHAADASREQGDRRGTSGAGG